MSTITYPRLYLHSLPMSTPFLCLPSPHVYPLLMSTLPHVYPNLMTTFSPCLPSPHVYPLPHVYPPTTSSYPHFPLLLFSAVAINLASVTIIRTLPASVHPSNPSIAKCAGRNQRQFRPPALTSAVALCCQWGRHLFRNLSAAGEMPVWRNGRA